MACSCDNPPDYEAAQRLQHAVDTLAHASRAVFAVNTSFLTPETAQVLGRVWVTIGEATDHLRARGYEPKP